LKKNKTKIFRKMLVIDNFLSKGIKYSITNLFLSSANIDFFLFCHQLCYFIMNNPFFHDGKEIIIYNITKVFRQGKLNKNNFIV